MAIRYRAEPRRDEEGFGDEALPLLPAASFDVRVQQQNADGVALWPGQVSLSDFLCSSLLTYDSCIEPSGEGSLVREPKAIYVQYASADPVTGIYASVVVPAQLSLDAYADPDFWYMQPPDPEPVRVETPEAVDDDRQKLRSSIKGDPILTRAKPATPHEPYFAPLRSEMISAWGSNAVGRIAQSSTTNWLQPATPGGSMARGSFVKSSTMSYVRPVENAGTMSSFLKAEGRDKYARSRLQEIDHILSSAMNSPQHEESQRSHFISEHVGRKASDAGDYVGSDGTNVGPNLSPTDLQDTPCDDNGAALDGDGVGPIGSEVGLRPGAVASLASPPRLATKSLAPPPRLATTSNATGFHGGVAITTASASSARGAAARGRGGGRLPMVSDLAVHVEQMPHFEKPQVAKQMYRGRPRAVRALDPHLDTSVAVPTRRMHCNWPDGLKRQIACHFYGMDPAQILEEEDKERLNHRKPTTDGEEARAQTPRRAGQKADQRTEALERSLGRGVEDDSMLHGLEIRIRNGPWPERVVVGRRTPRAHADGSKALSRGCILPGKLEAQTMFLKTRD